MKRFLISSLLALGTIFNLSAQISFTPTSLTWTSNDVGSKVVTVHSSGYWETDSTTLSSHFALSRYNGWDGVEILINPLSVNTSGSAITENIAFTQGGFTGYLQLTHSAKVNTLSVSPSSINWSHDALDSRTITVTSNTAWTASTSADWVVVSTSGGSGNGSIAVSPSAANPYNTNRTATLYVSCGGITQYVSLSQGANPTPISDITLTPSVLEWDAESTVSRQVQIVAGSAWHTDSTSLAGSFSLSRFSGPSVTELTVSPYRKNRTDAEIHEDLVFYDSYGNSAVLRLEQSSWRDSFSANPKTLTWGNAETTWKTVSIECPDEWNASISGDGFALSSSSGTGSGTVSVRSTVTNPSTSPRQGALVITGSGGMVHRTVTLIQEGIDGGYKGGAGSVDFNTGESLSDYAPGISIPYEKNTNAFGSVAYSVPIAIAPGLKNVPQLALSYNSMAGDSQAGYGWDLAGLSAISVTNKTEYYDGVMSAADADASDAVYSLDGMRLVQNNTAAQSATWQYETATGHIAVKKHTDIHGHSLWFEAFYPNGMRAIFGDRAATTPSVVYPIKESIDRDGNWVHYEYATDSVYADGIHPIQVEYGMAGLSTALARIVLTYEARTNHHARYLCGRTLGNSVLLKSIVSLNGADTLRRYDLVHEESTGMQMLTRIRCRAAGGQEAAPLRFHYGKDGVGEGVTLKEGTAGLIERAFPEGTELVTVRGKFIPDSYNDGIIVYPRMASYPENQHIVVVPQIDEFVSCANDTLVTGTGFETIQAVDVNGDGTDEIVRINKIHIPLKDWFVISVFGINSIGELSLYRVFDFQINDWGDACGHFWGDFLGNGKAQLAEMQYIYDTGTSTFSTRLALIDPDAGTKLSETILFSGGVSSPNHVFSADIDSDGVSELCRLTSSGIELWHASASTGAFSLWKTLTGINTSALASGRGMYQTDLNGDGYLDILVPPSGQSSYWGEYRFNGQYFTYAARNIVSWTSSSEYMFMDMDRDGLPDMVKRSGAQVGVYLNVNGMIGTSLVNCPAPLSSTSSSLIPCNTMRYGAPSSMIVLDRYLVKTYEYGPIFPELHLLAESSGSLGEYSSYTYGYIPMQPQSGISIYTKADNYNPSTSNGYISMGFPMYLVRTEQTREGKTSPTTLTNRGFIYRSAVVNTRGLGFCGFKETETMEYRGSDTYRTISKYDPERRGVLVSDTTYVNGNAVSGTNYSYDNHVSPLGIFNPRLTGSLSNDYIHGISESLLISGYDAFDFPLSVSTTKCKPSIIGSSVSESVDLTYLHFVSDTLLVLGNVTGEVRTKEVNNNGYSTHKERIVTAYNGKMRPDTIRQYVYNGNPSTTNWNLVSDRIVAYDAKGNIVSDQAAMHGATTYNETIYTYDAVGRYLIGSTDPLGRTTSYTGLNKYGNPTQTTDWLNRSTYYTYNVWGETSQKTNPDGSEETTVQTWSTNGDPGLYCVTETASGQPMTKVWYNAIGREVCSAEQRFDGVWMRRFTEYDSRGRVSRRSLPLRDDAFGSYQWSTYAYDIYDRPVTITDPSGRQTAWSYSGTSTTTTNEGMISTTTTDAAGNVVNVVNGGGTITYTLRDDGQPASVAITPKNTTENIVTTFTYDVYGRRASIIDPSAGTRADVYTDNANGTSSVEHTGPNGTMTTNYDRYGRVTSVTRPEFNTSYTYGTTLNASSYGKLISEVSTNGTGKAYSYDNLGRVATETEQADSSHTLSKTYTYYTSGPAIGSLASIVYATQDGTITTESHNYTYGHVSSIAATGPGNTSINVFTLTAESDMGQPAMVTSGTAFRNYGYTEVGLPSERRIQNSGNNTVQHFEYSYNPLNGNMVWRKDSHHGYKENFTYDALNRLLTTRQEALWDGYPGDYEYDHADTYFNSKGNVTYRDNDGVLECFINYDDPVDPYKATGTYAMGLPDYLPEYGNVSMTSFDRPIGLSHGDDTPTTIFIYDADGERRKMVRDEDEYGIHLDRYYLGGVYEKDDWRDGYTDDVERLFLGGTAYSAPMVLVKTASVNNNVWTPFNIGRDVQGSITEVLTESGSVVETFRYDPWGLMVNAEEPSDAAADTLVFLQRWQWAGRSMYVGGHGYTGHEHLSGWGLVNMNARLYDPALGRFLSPDPLIQDPESTQNFNRYSYCLNNPLKYTDESGEFFVVDSFIIGLLGRGLERAKQMAINDAKIWLGLFNVDKNDNLLQAAWHLLSRFTWELRQTLLGFTAAQFVNTYRLFGGVDSVEYLHGATVLRRGKNGLGAITLSSFIIGPKEMNSLDSDKWFQHEFGHVLQSQEFGLFWLGTFGAPSLWSAINDNDGDKHSYYYTEQDANARALDYFIKHSDSFVHIYPDSGRVEYDWDDSFNPLPGYQFDVSTDVFFNQEFLYNSIFHFSFGHRRKVYDYSLINQLPLLL